VLPGLQEVSHDLCHVMPSRALSPLRTVIDHNERHIFFIATYLKTLRHGIVCLGYRVNAQENKSVAPLGRRADGAAKRANPQRWRPPSQWLAIGSPQKGVDYLRLRIRFLACRLRMYCGAISSSERQYLIKESDDHLPVAFTTSGGVPAINNSVVPPIRKQ
jgi:hypothetical protein